MALGLPAEALTGPADTASPATPRPAATVVLVRRAAGRLEVLLTQRPSTMAFAADLHVFPGGAVDAGDVSREAVVRSVVGPEEARAALGGDCTPDQAVGAFVAGVRELWEEAGVALVRPRAGPARSEALGRARAALLAGSRTIGQVAAELDLELRTDLLVALSRWVTPPILSRRFDARFFAAELPGGVEPALDQREIVAHRWATPRAALDAMAAREIELWPPTSATLQQLEHVDSLGMVRARLAPGRSGRIGFDEVAPVVVRVALAGAGGVGGQAVNAFVVGRHELVVVDPGDPSEAAADALLEVAAARSGRIAGVAITSAYPDHAAGAVGLAMRLRVPLFAGGGAGRDLPGGLPELGLLELDDGDRVPAGDVALVAVTTPGPRADHTAWLAPEAGAVMTGDLVGPGPSRAVLAPPDAAAWRSSLARVSVLGPRRLLPGHGDVPPDVTSALETQRRRLPR